MLRQPLRSRLHIVAQLSNDLRGLADIRFAQSDAHGRGDRQEPGVHIAVARIAYGGMFVGLTGLAVAFNTLWLLAALVVAIIRFGVVAREEGYLERKLGDAYRDYKARVRRWL